MGLHLDFIDASLGSIAQAMYIFCVRDTLSGSCLPGRHSLCVLTIPAFNPNGHLHARLVNPNSHVKARKLLC